MLAVLLAAEILVGVTGYDESPEFAEVVTNGESNLFVQWRQSDNLIPGRSKLMDAALFEKAKANRVRVMTIYGDQDGARTKALREAWGDLYLGNNLGEYAGFLYQDEKSYAKNWPLCRDLKEARGWLGGTPHGQVDVMNVDDAVTAGQLSRYKVAAFGGWNTMTPKIASALREYAERGGQVALCVPQLSSRVDREFADYTASDIVQAVPGVTVKSPTLVEDILMVVKDAPGVLKSAYPACLSAKLRVADAALSDGVEVVASMGKKPYLVKAPCGKGAFWLCLAWDYPAARRESEEVPSFRRFRMDFWRTLLTGLVDSVQTCRVTGEVDYVNWAVYPNGTIYLLNTDCVEPRTVCVGGSGERIRLEPKEVKEIRPKSKVAFTLERHNEFGKITNADLGLIDML